MARKRVVAGNWKMYKIIPEAVEFVTTLAPLLEGSQAEVYLAVPYTAIASVVEAVGESEIVIGAQNMNDAGEGAYTGEIAARMLLDVGARFVVLGHSERRHVFGETSAFVNKKVKRALAEGLQPILCVGETIEEREAGRTDEILAQQLEESLEGIDDLNGLILAYEPVWAIGTGHSATPEEAQKEHAFLRAKVREKWGDAADELVIQYGGSVKPANAGELMSQPDIDGVLVGGASLSATSFSEIVRAS